jgi:teichuronic acid exporter
MGKLKNDMTYGILWSVLERFSTQGMQFILGIVLARLLTPSDYGLIAMTAVFLSISHALVDSGFSQALIQKKNTSEKDFHTIFHFNFLVSILVYSILFFLARPISVFYEIPQLSAIIEVIGLNLILHSFSIIPIAKLSRKLDFKTLAKATLLSVAVSGVVSIYLAYQGWGVWALVAQVLIKSTLNSILLYILIQWRPKLIFSKESFNTLFGFGSNLLATGLLNAVYNNFYTIVIGKVYDASQLGLYTRANQLQKFPSESVTTVIQRVTYPALCSIQDSKEKLERYYRKIIRLSAFVIFPSMVWLAVVAEPFIVVILTETWMGVVPFLQLLAFVGILYPIHAMNLDILKVKGRSDLFLKLDLYKKIIITIVLFVTFSFGIKIMIIGQIFTSIGFLYINTYYTNKLIKYKLCTQLKDILPIFILSTLMGGLVYLSILPIDSDLVQVFLAIIAGPIYYYILASLLKFEELQEIKKIIIKLKNKG